MIDQKVLDIASNNKFNNLKNIYTHKAEMKNNICGDKIKIELVVKKNRINSFRYETESCLFCQASASLLSRKIKVFSIDKLNYDLSSLKEVFRNKNIDLPIKLKDFKDLINYSNSNRINCIMLPFVALKKALKL